ncbi:hypothetical protein ABGB07_34165 [Micromonosporaceae bacterium B7E4]
MDAAVVTDGWQLTWLRERLHTSDRMALIACVTVRLAAVVMLLYTIPLVWPHFAQPVWAVVTGFGLVTGTALVVWLWLRAGTVRRHTLTVDLPLGAAALAAGPWIAHPGDTPGWTYFPLPYTVQVSFTLGFACRRALGAVAAGALWAGVCVVSMVTISGADPVATAAGAGPSYLAYPLVGWLCARVQRRMAATLDTARSAAVDQAARLAAERERVRHVRALHDRLLQTLEALARNGMVTDLVLRGQVRAQAEWLRLYVEGGGGAEPDGLASGLVAAVRAARRLGLRVEVNDASLQLRSGIPELPADQREALVGATHQLLSALAGRSPGTILRVQGQAGGVLVTILSEGRAEPPDPAQVVGARATVAVVGGTVTVEPLPYLEIWVPPSTPGDGPGAW